MQLVLKRKTNKQKTPKRNMGKLWVVHQERKENPTHKKYDTWLLLYPTTKAWASLKFYTTITLNIQFLNVFTEPAMHYKGAFQLCFKKRGGGRWEQSKVIGFLSVFLIMLVICLYTILTCKVSAVPHQAQCRYSSHSGWGEGVGWGEGRGCRKRPSSCVCVRSEEEWPTDVENLWRE